MVEKLLAGIDDAEDMTPDLLGRLHLACNFVSPVVRHVAVGTYRTYPRAIGVVDGWQNFLIDVGLHLMATDAELLGIGGLHCGIETTPKQHPTNKATHGEKTQAEVTTGGAKGPPKGFEKATDSFDHGASSLAAET